MRYVIAAILAPIFALGLFTAWKIAQAISDIDEHMKDYP